MRYARRTSVLALLCVLATSSGCSDSHKEPPADITDGTDAAELGPDANPDSEDDANPNALDSPPAGNVRDVRGASTFELVPLDEEEDAIRWGCSADAYTPPVCVAWDDDILEDEGYFVAKCDDGEWTFIESEDQCYSRVGLRYTREDTPLEIDDDLFVHAIAAAGAGPAPFDPNSVTFGTVCQTDDFDDDDVFVRCGALSFDDEPAHGFAVTCRPTTHFACAEVCDAPNVLRSGSLTGSTATYTVELDYFDVPKSTCD